MDEIIKEKVKSSGLEETAFVEWSVLRCLIERGKITKAEIQKMADEGRIRPATVLLLQSEKVLK